MSFKIHFQNKVYDGETFASMIWHEDYAANTARFLYNWYHKLPFIFFTSGSTGAPHAFGFNKEQLQASARLTITALRLRDYPQHIFCCINPKFVGGAMMIARALELDCEITLVEPNANVLALLSEDHPYTFASFVPIQLNVGNFSFSKFNRFRQVLIGGANIAPFLETQLKQGLPETFHTYGMTETLSHVALRRVGKEDSFYPLAHVKIKMTDGGCICIKTNFINHWIETHDEVNILNDGSFKVLGRSDFVINSGGIKLNPEQIENAISEALKVKKLIRGNFMISSISDDDLGQKCICVTTESISKFEFQELIDMISDKLPKYHLPKEIRVISEWPLTENGKTDRNAVKELIHNQGL
ncbi:MAG: AMP-binding protein [Bacteroidia bacterium]|nr:AMP-binding protein [Bacteroidia bacterium]